MKDLGVSVMGNLKKSKPHKLKTKKLKGKRIKVIPEEGTVNSSTRTIRAEYLQNQYKTVGALNEKGEYEIKQTKHCSEGDTVFLLEDNNTFTKTKIFKGK